MAKDLSSLKAGQRLSINEITKAQITASLFLYPALISTLSAEKTGNGKRSLLDLDKMRFETLPDKYRSLSLERKGPVPFEKEDIVTLVEWKLRHGTFRPNLLAMAQNNHEEEQAKVTLSAFKAYEEDDSNPKRAIKELCSLRGIGPATASLLLSIHDPERVPFFSDEAFIWLCRRGDDKSSIKYTAKEYDELVENVRNVRTRLDVKASDLEKVAFVLMSHSCPELFLPPHAAPGEQTDTSIAEGSDLSPNVIKELKGTTSSPLPKKPTKRKAPQTEASPITQVSQRRSKRNKTELGAQASGMREDQISDKTRVGESEIQKGAAKRLKSAASMSIKAVASAPRKKLEPAVKSGPAGTRNKEADDVLSEKRRVTRS